MVAKACFMLVKDAHEGMLTSGLCQFGMVRAMMERLVTRGGLPSVEREATRDGVNLVGSQRFKRQASKGRLAMELCEAGIAD